MDDRKFAGSWSATCPRPPDGPFHAGWFNAASRKTYELLGIRAKLRHPASPVIVSRGVRLPAVTRLSCFLTAEFSQFFGPSAHIRRSFVNSVKQPA